MHTHNKHGVCYLVFANTASQNDHPSFAGLAGKFVQIADVLHDIQDESRVFERVEVNHDSNRSICQSRAEDGNIILGSRLSLYSC